MGTYVIMKEDYGIFKKGLVYRCIGTIGNDEAPTDFSIETSDRKHNVCIKMDKAELFTGIAYKCLQVVGDPAIKVGNIYPEDHKDLWIWQKDWPEYFEKIDCRNVEVPEFNEEGVPKGHSDFKGRVSAQLDIIKEMLVEKNRKYGNSALEPIRVFSKASAIEQIKVRLDDKLSRLKTQDIEEDEDVLQDLIGYLVLLRMAIVNEPSKRGKGH